MLWFESGCTTAGKGQAIREGTVYLVSTVRMANGILRRISLSFGSVVVKVLSADSLEQG